MPQLTKLKVRVGNPTDEDELLEGYLEDASQIICNIRNSNRVEDKFLGTQVRMAVELYNKMGAEGQTGHGENGISRTYSRSDISDDLLRQVTPIVKSPYSGVRVIL